MIFRKIIITIFILSLISFSFNCGPTSDDWISKEYSEGFSLKYPKNYRVEVIRQKYIFISTINQETGSAFILVYPFFLNKLTSSKKWFIRNLHNLSNFFSKPKIMKSKQIRTIPDEWMSKFYFKKEGKVYQGLALCSIFERSGILYIIASEKESFETKKYELIKILESFKFTEPKKKKEKVSKIPKVKYYYWQDPIERAFSLDVPQGWKIEGGTFRRAPVDIIHTFLAQNPNKTIQIQFNDSRIPIFALPTPILTMSGFIEGTWYSPGYGIQMLVKRYKPGRFFLIEYLQTNFAPNLFNFEIVSQKDRPDVVNAFNRIYAQFMGLGISFTLHSGEVAFCFFLDQEPFVGYGLAVTQIVQSMGMQGGNWSVPILFLYTCPASQVELVRKIAEHMFKSIKMNPQWVASQQQIAINVSQIVSQTNQEICRIINDSYWNRQKIMDKIYRKFSNAILGQTDVIDPETGETWKVEAGHNYYWRKSYTNEIVGTKIYERPDIDFTPLKEF